MIERFNFYDIYGYLLPGLAFLALLWLPFGIFEHVWPTNQLSSAVAALAFAYIVGNLLQTLAGQSLPSKQKDNNGLSRYPSSFFLDKVDDTFSADFKKRIGDTVLNKLQIDVAIGDPGGDEKIRSEIDRRRREAFFLCRAVLIKNESAKYAEQFEGMYSMMRGLSAAFFFGFIYIAGWAVSLFHNQCLRTLGVIAAAIGILGSVAMSIAVLSHKWKKPPIVVEKLISAGVMVTLLVFGYFSGIMHIDSASQAILSGFIAVAAFFVALRFYGAYQSFAQEFAKAVWRDFVAHQTTT